MNSAKIFILVLATLTVVSSAQVPSNDFAAHHQGHNDEFQHDPDISIKEDNADFFKEDAETKANCPNGWSPYGSKCYKAFFTKREWAEARDYCEDEGTGGSLVSIYDSNLNSMIASMALYDDVWIGLNDRDKEGTFRWEKDNAYVDYQRWAKRQPDDGAIWEHENCVVTNFNGDKGYWNDTNCDHDEYFVCQRDEVTN